jgi:hypothetical protein
MLKLLPQSVSDFIHIIFGTRDVLIPEPLWIFCTHIA